MEPVRLSALPGELHGADLEITGITSGTSFVHPGDLFAGLPGTKAHGASYARTALDAGAVAVLTDEAGRAHVPAGVPVVVVPDVRADLGSISSAVYGRPSSKLTVLGVTGTSGKTTTTFLMEAGLRAAGRVPGLIGTVGIHIGETELKTGFTTPEAPELQALLAVMVEAGVTDVAMEVSSHALALGRVGGVAVDVGGFTNLSEDHLDFHADMEDYFRAKVELFSEGVWPVIVIDDVWGERLVRIVGECTPVSSSSAGEWYVDGAVRDRPDGSTEFTLCHREPELRLEAACAIPGRYNVANVVLAVAMLARAGVDPAVAVAAISTATVPGRMEPVSVGQPFLAVVDYSHKPAAVEGALKALRPLTKGRLVIVLGCGGDRDRGKRPTMGEIAARGADLLIVTDDNPRSEVAAEIRRAMLDGALAVPRGERGEVIEVGDRVEAIAAAVAVAEEGDTVLVAGKGHELGQEIDGVIYPFDDRIVLRNALLARRP
ncbi:MAG: UDP-N-acetylmuramoyl-L-alanyl-D-glutamate--2,6-diaminopimelate ligase [Jatrophihabitans sp.]|nr:UDP-N-acetylmuramoyl-L-alanyl-D-glutamate--2,6-diaminopimelate ligase [Jatrophihabitans sp.]